MSASGRSLKILATYGLGRNTRLSVSVARGSVVDFFSPKNGAIVNAANEACLGGGGVDGAITAAGGRNLARDRAALPLVSADGSDDDDDDMVPREVRCPIGSAVTTGPGDYGDLMVPFVVHAVGPNYHMYDGFDAADRLLRSAYQSSLEQCRNNEISEVAFSLLSAGVFRGQRQAEDVLRIGVEAIRDWSLETAEKNIMSNLTSVTLCGFSERETELLLDICETELIK